MPKHFISSFLQRYYEKLSFIFIVTYGRSGSTLLQRIVGSNRKYLIRGENNDALYYLFKSYERIVVARDLYKTGKIKVDQNDSWYGIDLVDPKEYARKLARVFIQEVLMPTRGVHVLGFKEIRYIDHLDDLEAYMDFLLSTFPHSKIVFNTRRAEDVALSWTERGWMGEKRFDQAVTMIRACDEFFQSYKEKHQDRCYMVDYDRYVANPDVLRGLSRFLGEPFDRKKLHEILQLKRST